jgi:hypothetical protein
MRARGVGLAVALAGWAAPAGAQTEAPRTAEQFIETAREAYSVDETRPEACPAPVGNEIVVCRQLEDPDQFRVASPTERANAAGQMPPDPIPSAPNVDGPGIFRGKGITMGKDPPPIYIIDLAAIPEALTPEEAALVFRAEDRPNPEAASPAAAP